MHQKIYFASDFHLGIDALESSSLREKKIIKWLDSCQADMKELYLVGDVFDYWYEYKTTVPKGYVRLFGKLAELVDQGVAVYFFTGNHDMWMFDYFKDELGITTFREPIIKTLGDKIFFIGHGDGLGPGDYGYKMIKQVFNNPVCQSLFSMIHPTIALNMMRYFSQKSRQYAGVDEPFLTPSTEWLVQFCESHVKENNIDYYIFGHRHLPINHTLTNQKSKYINLGEWMFASSFAYFDGNEVHLDFFESKYTTIYGM